MFDQLKMVNGEAIIEFFRKTKSAYASMSVIHKVLDGTGFIIQRKKSISQPANNTKDDKVMLICHLIA
ncbi:MAG: hypothetical protein ACPGEF_06595 [Endozoicomonas sp.]